MEIVFSILYALLIGFYNAFKKIALKKSGETAIMIIFTTIAFALSMIWIPFGVAIPWEFVPVFAFKGFLLALSWYIILRVLKDVDLSAVTITNVLSAVLTFVLGIIIFKETANAYQITGSIIVVLGVALLNLTNKNSKNKLKLKHFLLLLISIAITTCSCIIDKYTTTYLSAGQVQFWYLFFVMIFSWVFFLFDCVRSKKWLITRSDLANYWSYILGAFLFVGDMMLFLAYKVPNSQMIIINVIAKLQVIVPVLIGIWVFKEKKIALKIILTLFIVLGVALVSIS